MSNAVRGEAQLSVGGADITLRPSFAALVAAEEELGSLFALVERASEGGLRLAEVTALFDHLSRGQRPEAVTRERIGEALAATGLVRAMAPLRVVLGQILQGR